MLYSDPGQDNFWPLWDDKDGQIAEAMKSLTEHSEGWAQSCTSLLSALSSTSDDEMRRDIAICIGQQNNDTRAALIQAGAPRVLEQAMAKTTDSEARYMLDFAMRSLARHSDGRSAAIEPSKLAKPARTVTQAFFVRGASVPAKAVSKKAGSVKNAAVKKAPAKKVEQAVAKGKAAAKGKAVAKVVTKKAGSVKKC